MGAGGEASTFCVLSRSVLSISLRPHGQWPTRLLCPWGFSRQEYWSGLPCHPPGDLPNRGIKHRCPALLVDSLRSELPRKPMNTEVGSLFLLQGNFLTQELNQGLLHCRQILYQLSYQGRPIKKKLTLNPATFPNTITSVGNCRKARTRGLVV